MDGREDTFAGAGMSSEVTITPEMIEAGVDAVCKVDWRFDSYEDVAAAIYRAMHSVVAVRKQLLGAEIE